MTDKRTSYSPFYCFQIVQLLDKIWLYDPSYKSLIPDSGRIINAGRLLIFLFSN